MKLFPTNAASCGFEFTPQEKQLFFEVLALYPLTPPAHQRLSRTPGPDDAENQKLLEEALAAHRQETRQRVQALLTDPRSFQAQGEGYSWTVSREDLEWLLQVLNDVRVGSWLALGSPKLSPAPKLPSTPEAWAHRRAMDIAGGFEMLFIAALAGELPV
jgi:hypothetical protein